MFDRCKPFVVGFLNVTCWILAVVCAVPLYTVLAISWDEQMTVGWSLLRLIGTGTGLAAVVMTCLRRFQPAGVLYLASAFLIPAGLSYDSVALLLVSLLLLIAALPLQPGRGLIEARPLDPTKG